MISEKRHAMYELICVNTQGFSHLQNDIPCEDHGMVRASGGCKVFAAADGHGDPNCPRSAYGSEKACEIALDELEIFQKEIAENDMEESLLTSEREAGRILRQLAARIISKWIQAVNDQLEAEPLTDEERDACDVYRPLYDEGRYLEHIYGTTLAAGLQTENYLLLVSQGDCRCAVFHEDGSVTEPVPWDDKCLANVTTSLCDEDAAERCRFSLIDLRNDPVIACIVSSDGVEDSFADLELEHAYFRRLLIEAGEKGTEAMEEALQESLPELSKSGSGDDITICGIIDAEACKKSSKRFLRDKAIIETESLVRDLESRLRSINGMGKVDALRAKYEKAKTDEEAALEALDEIRRRIAPVVEEYQEIIERKEDLEKRLEAAKEQLSLLETEV